MSKVPVIIHYAEYWLLSILNCSFYTILGGCFAILVGGIIAAVGKPRTEIPYYCLPAIIAAVILAAAVRLSGVLTNYPAIFPSKRNTLRAVTPETSTEDTPIAKYSLLQGLRLLLPRFLVDLILFPTLGFVLAEIAAERTRQWTGFDLKAPVYIFLITLSGIRQIDCVVTLLDDRAQWQQSNVDSDIVSAKVSRCSMYRDRATQSIKKGRAEIVLNIGIMGYVLMMKRVLTQYHDNQPMIIGFALMSLCLRCFAQRFITIFFMPGGAVDGKANYYALLRKSLSITSIVLQTLIRVVFSLFCTKSAVVATVFGFVAGELISRGMVAMFLNFETRKWRVFSNNSEEKAACEMRISIYLEEIEADMKGEYVAIIVAFLLEVVFGNYSNFALRGQASNGNLMDLGIMTGIQILGELVSDAFSMILESYALSSYLSTHIERTKLQRKASGTARTCIAFYVGVINVFFCCVVLIGNFKKSSCE